MAIGIPLTGAGDSTATVATDQVSTNHYQYMKLANGVAGSSVVASVLTTTPGSTDGGLVTRIIASTGFTQAAVLTAGSSDNVIGQVTLQAGTSLNSQMERAVPMSSGNIARTTVNTSANASVIAANANRIGLIIANLTTGQLIGLGLSTGTVTTGMAFVDVFLPAQSHITFGLPGSLPLWRGPIRGINLTSTSVAGGVGVNEFT